MIRLKVYNVMGVYLFNIMDVGIPEKGTVLIMPDGRYLNIISVRRNLKYDSKIGAYQSESIDIVISDYGDSGNG